MSNARRQAEEYVFRLPPDHPAPPFLIVCDVGRAIELYADFSGSGRNYTQFPDRQSFRIFMEDLQREDIRARLAKVWTDPQALDPTRHAASVTRAIAKRLATVSRALEKDHPAEEVAFFLMRCIFTMFAENVELLPRDSFSDLLKGCLDRPEAFAPLVVELWSKMDEPDRDRRFFSGFKTHLRHFNGRLFHNARAFALKRQEIEELLGAAERNWREVDPAIFGTLLEQALDKAERARLGAHYTPKAYVERLVGVTVMEPLRRDWQMELTKAEQAKEDGDVERARGLVRAFHRRLCATRVLDPACGTGNFLYVALEMMKKLEGEVLETLAELGASESIGLETVDPHQFLGLEVNPRAAAIAELVLWIGYLQQHYRTHSGHPAEPILRAFNNVQRQDAVLEWVGDEPRPARWPQAEFIVGNPPFVSNREMRSAFDDRYIAGLKRAYPEFTQAADFVLFFWLRAARGVDVRRIGFISTSRLRMKQNNAVFRAALAHGWSIRFAIPDHGWPSHGDSARVRVCFVALDREAGPALLTLAPDHDRVARRRARPAGDYVQLPVPRINPDLSAGIDAGRLAPLLAGQGLCSAGVKPYARGLHVDGATRDWLLPDAASRARHGPPIYNGHDVGQRWRGLHVLDFNTLDQDEVRTRFPRAYNHILEHVRPVRERERNRRLARDFWRFEADRAEMREASSGLVRRIVTLENSPQRYFVFLPAGVLPDQKLRVVSSDDAYLLGVLGSRAHSVFSRRVGGRAGQANTPVYNTLCFTAFPFPAAGAALTARIRAAAETLDATRARTLAEQADLTLTGLYSVLERVRAGAPLSAADEDVKRRGLVWILRELHDEIDACVAEAYGWPAELDDAQMFARLAALNASRATEERSGLVRWLRPDYQRPRFARRAPAAPSGRLALAPREVAAGRALPLFPRERGEQPLAVLEVLSRVDGPLDPAALAHHFRRGGRRVEARIGQVLVTLARYGRVTAISNGSYVARRAA